MSRISEFESRTGKKDREPEVQRRRVRSSWPSSARFAMRTMVILNLLLVVFLVRSELKSSRRAQLLEASRINAQKVVSQPNIKSQQAPMPAQNPTSLANPVQAPADQVRVSATPRLAANLAMNRPVHQSKSGGSKFVNARQDSVAMPRPSVTPRQYNFEPSPQARYAAPQFTPSGTAAPVFTAPAPAAALAPNPIPISPLPAAVAPFPSVASIHTPTAVVRSNQEARPKVTAPSTAENSPRKIQPALYSNSNQKQEIRVASVGLPGMDKGIVVPKTPVGSLNPKIEIVHRPPEKSNAAPNCGGAIGVPCPTLKKRAASINPDGDRW